MKKVLAMSIMLALLTVLCGCIETPTQEGGSDMKIKANYAAKMYFDSTVGPRLDINDAYATGNYHECVLVGSEAESHGYGDDVIVAWPRGDTEKILYNFNHHVSNEGIDLSPFSLTYPITMDDVVNKWEDVNNLYYSFSSSARDYILDPSHASA